jgi:restriction system protein
LSQKHKKLCDLQAKRREDNFREKNRRWDSYKDISEYQKGCFDFNGCVSPWTKSARNLNANFMLVAQDWASDDYIKGLRVSDPISSLGYNPELRSNKTIQKYLFRFLGISFEETYATNAFVFVKPGDISAQILTSFFSYSVNTYLKQEIEIIAAPHVLCLGMKTYRALAKLHKAPQPSVDRSSLARFQDVAGITYYCLPHPGGHGTASVGGNRNVEGLWEQLGGITT